MSRDSQLDSLMRGLSARERAVLSIRALHEDRPEDPQIRLTMPGDQVSEFNRYIGLANGVLGVLVPYALALRAEVEVLAYKHLLVGVACWWGEERTLLRHALSFVAVLPISQTEYDERLDEARAERLELRDVFEIVEAERDLPGTAAGRRRLEREVRAAVASGELRATSTSAEFRCDVGALYDWLGKPVEPYSDYGWRFSPVPDAEYEEHRWRREYAERAVASAPSGPSHPARVLQALAGDATVELRQGGLDQATQLFTEQLRRGICAEWSALLAVEQVTDEARGEFRDDAAIPDALRQLLAEAREQLAALHQQAARYVGVITLPDADEATLDRLRTGVHRHPSRSA